MSKNVAGGYQTLAYPEATGVNNSSSINAKNIMNNKLIEYFYVTESFFIYSFLLLLCFGFNSIYILETKNQICHYCLKAIKLFPTLLCLNFETIT